MDNKNIDNKKLIKVLAQAKKNWLELKIPSTILSKSLHYRKVQSDFKEKGAIFSKIDWIIIEDSYCQLFGNVTFLYNPFKCVISLYNEEKFIPVRKYLPIINQGGILVGSFISSVEKEFLERVWETPAKIILINQTPLLEGQLPSPHFLKRCQEGNLLIMVPYPAKEILDCEISITQYHLYRNFLNNFALKISKS